MVRSYLRHGPTEAFGLICSSGSNSAWDGRLAYVPALEDVLVWDVKRGQMMSMWHETGHRAEVTCIQRSPNKDIFAVGYADGSIRLWSQSSGSVQATFNGHKKAVTALTFDHEGFRLASGSQDTDLILWDVVGEAGLFRLHGHRDQITAIRFLYFPSNAASSSSDSASLNFLLTASKDTFLKLWNLSTQHCVQTIVAHSSEVWSLDVDPEQNLAFTGSAEGELKAWQINGRSVAEGFKENEKGELPRVLEFVQSIPMSTTHRVPQISFHPNAPILAVQSHDKSIDVFRIRTTEEVRRKQARRKKRAKEKLGKGTGETLGVVENTVNSQNVTGGDDVQEIGITDLFTPHLVLRASGKIRSFAFNDDEPKSTNSVQILTALSTNSVEVYNLSTPSKKKDEAPSATRAYSLDLPGHRADVRTLCLSSDDQILASASNGSLKLWNMKTTTCIRTMDCPYAICSAFLPGDRQIALGTKTGEILLYDVASSSLLQSIKAHSSTVWSIHVRPDERGLVSGGADKDVKFWQFEYSQTGNTGFYTPAISSLTHARTLKMTDDVLAVRFSPNGKLLAVALLDSTVKLFFEDTLKFFLSLYGHKLPVLSMDISSDSKLIITCSADKNVKIWGLDFGDCHRSIFAHDDSIMQIAFEKGSHYFWSVGKDKLLKYWDGDKFELIQKLDGHHAEIWALAVSHEGKFVVTGSHDKSIRVWEKLDEPLFLEEEREREMENIFEAGLADTLNRSDGAIGSGAPDLDKQNQDSSELEASAVTKQTVETLMAGERIIEALDLADAERASLAEYQNAIAGLSPEEIGQVPLPQKNAVLAAYQLEPEAYVLKVVERINSSALIDALLVLPFGKVTSLMVYLDEWAKREWNIPLVSRIMFFLLKTHHHQIVTHRVMRTSLIPLRKHLRAALMKQKDIVNYNLAALRYLKRQDDAAKTTTLIEELVIDAKGVSKPVIGDTQKKRKRIMVVS